MNVVTATNTGADLVSELDITGESCPMTLVRTRLALDRLPVGHLLLVRLSGAEPLLEVPRAAEELGHQVVSLTPAEPPGVSAPGGVTPGGVTPGGVTPGGVSLLLLRRC